MWIPVRLRLFSAPVVTVIVAMAMVHGVPHRGVGGGAAMPAAQERFVSSDDFPPLDQYVWSMQRRGLLAKLARQRLAEAPYETETAELLLATQNPSFSLDPGEIDRGLRVLGIVARLAEGDDADVDAAAAILARGLTEGLWELQRDGEAGAHRDRIEELLARIRSRFPQMPPEDSARVAYRLVGLDNSLNGNRGEYYLRLARFIEEHPGTEAALEARVDLTGDRDADLRVRAWEAFAEAHPGTVAGAKALFLLAFHFGHENGPRGSDPTERFLRVVALTEELESGRWPDCEWVERAPELVIGFFEGLDETYAPANVDRMLAAYRDFVARHLLIDAQQPTGNGVGYLVASPIADLYALRGDRVGGVLEMLDGLEDEVADPGAVRFLRASFLVRGTAEEDPDRRAALMEQGLALLDDLSRVDGDPWADNALAMRASQLFYERRFEAAVEAYSRYLARWPDSDWAWVAMLRRGQAQEALNDWDGAFETYRQAAASHPSPAPAAVYAHAFAARAAETLARFDDAIRHYREATAAWDDDFGQRYALYTRHAPPPGEERFIIPDHDSLTRGDLAERLAALNAAAEARGGDLLARGRRLIEQERWQAARSELESLLDRYPDSPLVPDARYLAHRARFENALRIADVESATADETAAFEELQALSGEPWDPAVGAASLAVAALLGKGGLEQEAVSRSGEALRRWQQGQDAYYASHPPASPAEPALAADVAAIRDVVFRPFGGGFYDHPRALWNAFDWPAEGAPFLIVNPDLTARLASGREVRVRVADPVPGLDNVLFLTDEHLGFLTGILDRLGGTETRPPRYVMETPNQPVGAAVEILELWKRFFPARQGHWSGWVLETYPIISRIDFHDEQGTRATADVTIGYSGCRVHLEKRDESWTVVRLSNFWIT